jgi:ABC-2 type transport system permease protein
MNVLLKTLRDQRWQIAGFGVALAMIAALDVAVWPAYRDTLQNLEIPPALQALLGSDLSIATPAGFLSSEFFSWTPVLLIVYGVIAGTGAIAGEDGAGTLELLLAQPVARRRVAAEKLAATAVGLVLTLCIAYLGFAVTVPFIAIDIGLRDIAAGVANMLPIALLFFTLSLWLGCVAPGRGLAVAVAVALATAAYVANTFAQGIDALHWLRHFTPFYYYGAGTPLVDGIDFAHAGLLLALAALFAVLAVDAADRRDVAGGGDVDLARIFRRWRRAGGEVGH